MSNYRVMGLNEIKMGAVNTTTYAMPSTFVKVPNIVPGTAKLGVEAPTKTKLFVEDSDVADLVMVEAGAKSIEFATRDMATGMLILALGGTSSGAAIWKSTTAAEAVVEKAIRIKTMTINGKYMTLDIPRAQVGGTGNLVFSNKANSDASTLLFSCEILRGQTASGTIIPPIKATYA